jgi:hypothetical protein
MSLGGLLGAYGSDADSEHEAEERHADGKGCCAACDAIFFDAERDGQCKGL